MDHLKGNRFRNNKEKIIYSLIFLFLVFRTVTSDSLDDWITDVDKRLDAKIINDPYNVYVDIKSDMDFMNTQCTKLKNDIGFQIAHTEHLLKYVGSEVTNKTSFLSAEVNRFPDVLDTMNKDFSRLKDSISGLPLKPPCYPKVSSAIDNIKGKEVGNLNLNIAYNENNKIVSENMLQIIGTMSDFAKDMTGKDVEDSLMMFRNKMSKQIQPILNDYTKNVQNTLAELDQQMAWIATQPEEKRAALAQSVKQNTHKKLEMVRAKTLMDLQTSLQFVVQSVTEMQIDAQEMMYMYDVVHNQAEKMAHSVDSAYTLRSQAAEHNGGKINKIAGLHVTNPDGTKLDSTEYIPAYSLNEKEEIFSAAQAGLDLVILITGTNEEDVQYTRKIFKMYVDDSTDWVYMWVYKEGKVVEEKKYIYSYDKTEC